jgi:hypothetical protein
MIYKGDIPSIHCKMSIRRPKSMRKVEGLLIFIFQRSHHVPKALRPRCNFSYYVKVKVTLRPLFNWPVILMSNSIWWPRQDFWPAGVLVIYLWIGPHRKHSNNFFCCFTRLLCRGYVYRVVTKQWISSSIMSRYIYNMCTYVRTYIHTYIHIYMHPYIHTSVHTYIHTYILWRVAR